MQMNRRKVFKAAAGFLAAGGAGLITVANVFKTENHIDADPHNIEYDFAGNWKYTSLDPDQTARLAYEYYKDGACMYAAVKSVVSQLAANFGEPYSSFPYHMFKYGQGGIGGYGSVCGALNGAAAIIGLLISDRGILDKMVADLFQWYEKAAMPVFKPANPVYDSAIPTSISNSVLCHASNTAWCKQTGFMVNSDERRERCRRLTSDVAKKVTVALNDLASNTYMANMHTNEQVNSCLACHGNAGKIKNTSSKMSCNSCHSESIGHRIFSDVHYRFMKE
jgi:hypothetical protein